MQCLALRLETSGLSERLERGGQGGGGGLWRLEMFERDGHFRVCLVAGTALCCAVER